MKLTGKEKVSYGLGAVGKDMVYMLSASYILYCYQDILGVKAYVMGIILLAARVFDAFNDPVMGVLVAKTRTRWGKFRPWLLIGTILNAIVLYFMFAAPPSLDGAGMVAYAAIFGFNPIWWLSLAILVSGCVMTSRMILRQHTLWQVLGGTLIGIVCGIVGTILM